MKDVPGDATFLPVISKPAQEKARREFPQNSDWCGLPQHAADADVRIHLLWVGAELEADHVSFGVRVRVSRDSVEGAGPLKNITVPNLQTNRLQLLRCVEILERRN